MTRLHSLQVRREPMLFRDIFAYGLSIARALLLVWWLAW